MNSDQLEGKWKQMKGSVKEKWGKLQMTTSMLSPANKTSWQARSGALRNFKGRSREADTRMVGLHSGCGFARAPARKLAPRVLPETVGAAYVVGLQHQPKVPFIRILTLRSYRSYLENRQPAPACTDTKLRRIIWLIADRAIPHHYCACRLF